jgi:guanylate kinase
MPDTKDRDRIFVFTGPDGSGRKSVAEAVGLTFGMVEVLSYTTRQPRSGEVNGITYHFITADAYSEMERRGEFLETVVIDGNSYGLKGSEVDESLAAHGCVYLILNREGATRIKNIYGAKVVRVFLFADRTTVQERQRALGLGEDVITRRMSHYDEAMGYRAECEHTFENIDLADTVSRITEILEGYLQRGLVDKD